MAKTHVLLDIDGCVLDWEKGLKQFINQNCPHISTAPGVDEHAYDLTERYGISKTEASQLIWDYHTHKSFADLEPLLGVEQALQLLADHFCLVAITACGSYPLTQQMRRQNLHSLFPHTFLEIHCTDNFEQKRHYLSQYGSGFWIEDHANNALMGLDYNHQCFLIDQPHNAHLDHPLITRVPDLLEAAELILAQSHSSCR
jgi:hypothetical protein